MPQCQNDYPSNPVIYAPNSKSLTIEVQGENTITASQAIFVTGDLTITGNGTLTVNGTTYAVYSAGNLVISGANVKANTTGTHGAGIHVNGSISIKDSDVVQSTSSGVWGMYGDKGISISDSVVTAASTKCSIIPACLAQAETLLSKVLLLLRAARTMREL